jgi:hypothetical protein
MAIHERASRSSGRASMMAISVASSRIRSLIAGRKPRQSYKNRSVSGTAQYQALKAVNKELVGLYWDIGCVIVQRKAGKNWGKSIVQQLAGDLQSKFPGIIPKDSHHWCEKLPDELKGQLPIPEEIARLLEEG